MRRSTLVTFLVGAVLTPLSLALAATASSAPATAATKATASPSTSAAPSTSAIPSTSETSAAPTQPVTLQLVSASGAGCPTGTAVAALSADRSAITITYSSFLAQAGPDVAQAEAKVSCHLALRAGLPAGYTYAVSRIDFRGYALLASGATTQLASTFHFVGFPTTRLTHDITGPWDDDWQAGATVEGLVFGQCGQERTMNIATSLTVDPGAKKTATEVSFITMDSTDTSVTSVYRLSWKRCA